MTKRIALCVALAVLASVSTSFARMPVKGHKTQLIEGWKVHVDKRLLGKQKSLGKKALRLLSFKLYMIKRRIPAKALTKLQTVPIWLGVKDPHGRHKGAVYHPSAKWLTDHGYSAQKERCVDLANAKNFLDWSRNQPMMVMHELAHAYHHQVLGYDHAELLAAFKAAVASKKYDSVLHINGRKERHYALSNVQEYFAEATEAYFGTNDFYPFVRSELAEHDKALYDLMKKVWGK